MTVFLKDDEQCTKIEANKPEPTARYFVCVSCHGVLRSVSMAKYELHDAVHPLHHLCFAVL